MTTELSGSEFGRVDCKEPQFPGAWVKFKTSGYPRKLRREWDNANANGTLEIILRYVEAWNIPALGGDVVALPAGERKADLMDDVEDALVAWLIRAFLNFWLNELTAARPNSLPPSPTT